MESRFDRRSFLKLSAAAAGGATLAGAGLGAEALAQVSQQKRTIRLGFVGIGGRGSYHLDAALGMEGVEIPALCEIRDDRLQRARQWVVESGRPTPRLYPGPTDYRRLCE